MSYRAIAAALALEDLSVEQRLTAFALASFANRQQRAWPSVVTAAARAGLGRRQYSSAQKELERRGLIALEHVEGRQASSALVRLLFAEQGASVDREVNAELFEATLARSRARGGARVLLAVLAALADDGGVVAGPSVEELCTAGGLADTSYRRARAQLLACGEVELDQAGGGRSRCNRWRVAAAAAPNLLQHVAPAQVVMPSRPDGGPPVARSEGPSQDRASSWLDSPRETPSQTPPETPPETPPSRARAGREPQNQRISRPPGPPAGGQPDRVVIVENFVSSRGRRRQRQVVADPVTELSPIAPADRDAWAVSRERLRQLVGDSMFEIWLAGLELIAVSRADSALLISGRSETALWVDRRYGRLLASLADQGGRRVRVASDRERQLHTAALANPSTTPQRAVSLSSRSDHQEVI